MKVLIVNNMNPFIWGGAEELAFHLQKNLEIAGHTAETLKIPFQWEPANRVLSQMLMVKAFELWNVDHVIALKFPAYLIRHPKKTIWLLHQYRQAYDLYDANQTNIPANKEGQELRLLIKNADNESFLESNQLLTNSLATRQRLLHYNGINAKVLLPPVNDPERFVGVQSGHYVFAGGRVNRMKRQDLLLEAMKYTDNAVKLLIAGPPDSETDARALKETVARLDLTHRVHLDLRFLPRETYANYMNAARAVAYLPFDEDSLGYVAMEGALASKALVTTTDSGGVLSLVQHQETGWVAEPSPQSLGEALNSVYKSTALTQQYGKAARALWLSLNVNWPQTVETLLQ